MSRHPSQAIAQVAFALLPLLVVVQSPRAAEVAPPEAAERRSEALPAEPPPLELSRADLEILERGDPVVRAVKVSDDERWAEAIYLFDAVPTEIFAVVTDPPTQQRIFDELEVYEAVSQHENGLSTHGVANVSLLIPDFEYWLRTRHDPLRRWSAWLQERGDFDANDGYWRFVYDEQRGKTIGAMRLHFALKGVLSFVPEWIIVRLQTASMPKSLRLIQEEVNRVREEQPEIRAERLAEWAALIENGVLERPLLVLVDEARAEPDSG